MKDEDPELTRRDNEDDQRNEGAAERDDSQLQAGNRVLCCSSREPDLQSLPLLLVPLLHLLQLRIQTLGHLPQLCALLPITGDLGARADRK